MGSFWITSWCILPIAQKQTISMVRIDKCIRRKLLYILINILMLIYNSSNSTYSDCRMSELVHAITRYLVYHQHASTVHTGSLDLVEHRRKGIFQSCVQISTACLLFNIFVLYVRTSWSLEGLPQVRLIYFFYSKFEIYDLDYIMFLNILWIVLHLGMMKRNRLTWLAYLIA